MMETELLRNAQRETEGRVEAERLRKVEMARIGSEFQAAVGNIVNAVSSASTELERAARTLDDNAQTTRQLSRSAASASEEASANVQSVATIKAIGDTIGRIAEIATAIAAAIEEQGATTQEISRNVQQAARGTSEVAGNVGELSRGADETGTASTQVLGSAQSLAQQSNRLKVEVEKFVTMVRAE